MLVLDAGCVLARPNLLDIDVANVICFTLLVVEEHVDILTVVNSRDHELSRLLLLDFLICSITIIARP